MKVKICGFVDSKPLQTAISAGCDFVGFVFCEKSVRNILPKKAAEIAKIVPKNIAKVAVVVDADFKNLQEIIDNLSPDFVQFHGEESVDFLKNFRLKFPNIGVIKAFKISTQDDMAQVNTFENCADYFLFDSKVAGSGEKFDWNILKNYHGKKSWFLSGGINSDNLSSALEISGAKMIDVSSGVEKIRGQKSSELILQLMDAVKKVKI